MALWLVEIQWPDTGEVFATVPFEAETAEAAELRVAALLQYLKVIVKLTNLLENVSP